MVNYFRVLYYVLQMIRHPYLTFDSLKEFQKRRLRSIVSHSYDNVPFYHRKFKELGLKPSDIRTVDDLNKLPLVSKDDIRADMNQMLSKKHNPGLLRMRWTSGSTGQPLGFYLSRKEEDLRKAKHLRGNIDCGQKPRDRWIAIAPPFRFADTERLQRILGIYAPIPVSVFEDPASQASVVEKLKPDLIDGYSSSLLLLARALESMDYRSPRPKFLFGGAELTDDISRRYMEKVFEAPFYDRYATIEMERMAWQCQLRTEYHIDADTIIMQFLDRNGDEVSPGERGEIVCTSLFNYAMPFIRYRIGDIGVPSDTQCPCGRSFPLMKVIEGRKDSIINLPNGRLLSPRTFTIAMQMFGLYTQIDLFRVVQRKRDVIEIYIKPKNKDLDEAGLEKELLIHLRKILNLVPQDVVFNVEFVDSIPLDKSGKLMAVDSEIED